MPSADITRAFLVHCDVDLRAWSADQFPMESLNEAREPAPDIVAEEFDVLESFDALLAVPYSLTVLIVVGNVPYQMAEVST